MPTYEFRCQVSPGHTATLNCAMSEIGGADLWCCNELMKRIFTVPGVVFKGGGFYRTDSRPAPPKPEKKETKTSD